MLEVAMTADLIDLLLASTEEDATIKVHLFSGPYVTSDGNRIEVPDGGQRLLAFVALHRRPVERRYAAGVLWPLNDDLRAAGNLRSALWRLNMSGLRMITATRSSLALAVGAIVDVDVVGEWAARLIDGHPRLADLDWLPWGVNAFDVLPGWYDDWALMARERLRTRVLHALESLSRRLINAGRTDQAIEAALLAVGADPLRESAQRALIEAHLAEGSWGEAQRRFLSYRELLRQELGTTPPFEMAQLSRSKSRVALD
jgi:DNA-binding SARP family transcriptional activator